MSEDERAADEATEAEAAQLDREVPAALDRLSPTAERFLDDPDVDLEAEPGTDGSEEDGSEDDEPPTSPEADHD